jgi:hypothetical protein
METSTHPKRTSNSPRTLLTVNQFTEKNPFATEGGLRFQIFNANQNGLAESGAIVRIGRKVLIDEGKYFAWIESQQTGNGKGGQSK